MARKRIKTNKVDTTAVVYEIKSINDHKRELFNEVIGPEITKLMQQGKDWATAKKHAIADFRIKHKVVNIDALAKLNS